MAKAVARARTPTSVAGSERWRRALALLGIAPMDGRRPRWLRVMAPRRERGFTLLELLVVVSIMALATTGAALALRDSAHTQLEREGERLAALLEAGRAQSRASGTLVRWRSQAGGFRFEGWPGQEQHRPWLDATTVAAMPGGAALLVLGPEPLIAPQAVWLTLPDRPALRVRVATNGLAPFAVEAAP